MRIVLLGLAAVLMTACSFEHAEVENVGRTSSAIIHGTESGSTDDAVIALAHAPNGSLKSFCTGTMVAPNLVLTARHCVSTTDDTAVCNSKGEAVAGGAVKSDFAAADLYVYTGASATDVMRRDGTSRAKAAARGKALVLESGTSYCNADVAFLVVDRDVSAPFAPIRTTSSTKAGERVTAVGYGLTAAGTVPLKRQRRAGIAVISVGPLPLAGLANAELLLGESSCSGDSGGPIFSDSGAVTGVVSRGGGGTGAASNAAGSCIGLTAFTVYTHLATKPDLVARAFAAATEPVWHEGTATPGDACEACEAEAAAADAGTAEPPATEPVLVDGRGTDAGLAPAPDAGAAAEVVIDPDHVASCAMRPGPSGTGGALVLALAAVLLRRRKR